MTRKICVITGSRADYGLLKLVMRQIEEDPSLTLQVIATGMHLSPTYGFTIREIEADGFEVDWKVECLSLSDKPTAIANATARALSGCAKALDELKPDAVLVLGDRFEIFAACSAALFLKIPIAHLHGGEVTVGAHDEALRHSVTKMSSIHFVATEEYGKRVVQLGEHPDTVHVVGGLGVDAIKEIELLTKNEVEEALGLKFDTKSLLVTFHSATLEHHSPREQIRELLAALSDRRDTTLIFTLPNADTGGREIMQEIQDFIRRHENAYGFSSLGQQLYLSCMRIVDGVVGNSSSGILEAPTLKAGTVNIGSRQLGRIQADSVINAAPNKRDIDLALNKLYSADFKSIIRACKNPYGDGGSSVRILKVLRKINLNGVMAKSFYDVSHECGYGPHHG